jgi:uncharacterized protein (DUF2384 family)
MAFSLKDIKRKTASSSSSQREIKCQKCLQIGHLLFQCQAEERPYVSRPSRSQQLKKPIVLKRQKQEQLESRKGLADKILKQAEEERLKGI